MRNNRNEIRANTVSYGYSINRDMYKYREGETEMIQGVEGGYENDMVVYILL